MQCALMMKSANSSGNNDFSEIAPRILNEKENIQEELEAVDWEERSLLKQLSDLNQRIALVGKRRFECQTKLENNDQLSKYWIIHKTTIVAQALEGERIKTEKLEALKMTKVETIEENDQIVQNDFSDDVAIKVQPKQEKFFSTLSTAVTTPLSNKIEIVQTIVPRVPRVKKLQKDKEEAHQNRVSKTGIFKKKGRSKKIDKIVKSIQMNPFKSPEMPKNQLLTKFIQKRTEESEADDEKAQ